VAWTRRKPSAPAGRSRLRSGYVHGILRLLEAELAVTGTAYLMAGVPVGGIVLAGRMSPLYRLPATDLCRWWSRCALLVGAVFLASRIAT
jgi:hypothetical protein